MIAALRRWVAAVCLAAGAVALFGLLAVTIADATLRTFGGGLYGSDEVIETLLAVVVATSVPLSVLAGQTVTITEIVDHLPPRPARAITLAAGGLAVAASGGLAYALWQGAGDAADFNERTQLLGIEHAAIYLGLAAGAGVTALAFALTPGQRQGGTHGRH